MKAYSRFESNYSGLADSSIGHDFSSPNKTVNKQKQYEYSHNPAMLRFAKLGARMMDSTGLMSPQPTGSHKRNKTQFKTNYQETTETLNKRVTVLKSNFPIDGGYKK